jgi:effector-binding domain-containing protein
VPAAVDGGSGYRRYATEQVADAQLIRRLRELEVPLAGIRDVLAAPDSRSRDAVLAEHLERMEAQLSRTRQVVASLRALLCAPAAVSVGYRHLPATPAVVRSARVTRAELAGWCAATFGQLYDAVSELGVEPAGPAGALYSLAFFENDEGEVSAYVPVPAPAAPEVLPGGRFAVALHTGPYEDFDRTYGALGSHVAEHDATLPEPIRELYLVGPDHTPDAEQFRTEVCWPVDNRI